MLISDDKDDWSDSDWEDYKKCCSELADQRDVEESEFDDLIEQWIEWSDEFADQRDAEEAAFEKWANELHDDLETEAERDWVINARATEWQFDLIWR